MWRLCLLLLWTGVLLDEGYVVFLIKIKLLSYVNFDDRLLCPMWLYLPRKCIFCLVCYNLYRYILATLLVHFTVWKTKNVPGYNICLFVTCSLLVLQKFIFSESL